jgi:hypothetical protein
LVRWVSRRMASIAGIMKLRYKLLLYPLICIALISFGANANPSHCYSIQNQDSKNLCLAMVNKQKSNCYSISSSDLKNMCLAQVGEQRSNCYSIQSSDMKNLCLAMVRWYGETDFCRCSSRYRTLGNYPNKRRAVDKSMWSSERTTSVSHSVRQWCSLKGSYDLRNTETKSRA